MKQVKYLMGLLSLMAMSPLLTACNPVGVNSAGANGVLKNYDEKAFYTATAAVYGLEVAAEKAVDVGALKPGSAVAVKIADALDAAKKALDKAYAAKAVADNINVDYWVQQALTAVAGGQKVMAEGVSAGT